MRFFSTSHSCGAWRRQRKPQSRRHAGRAPPHQRPDDRGGGQPGLRLHAGQGLTAANPATGTLSGHGPMRAHTVHSRGRGPIPCHTRRAGRASAAAMDRVQLVHAARHFDRLGAAALSGCGVLPGRFRTPHLCCLRHLAGSRGRSRHAAAGRVVRVVALGPQRAGEGRRRPAALNRRVAHTALARLPRGLGRRHLQGPHWAVAGAAAAHPAGKRCLHQSARHTGARRPCPGLQTLGSFPPRRELAACDVRPTLFRHHLRYRRRHPGTGRGVPCADAARPPSKVQADRSTLGSAHAPVGVPGQRGRTRGAAEADQCRGTGTPTGLRGFARHIGARPNAQENFSIQTTSARLLCACRHFDGTWTGISTVIFPHKAKRPGHVLAGAFAGILA